MELSVSWRRDGAVDYPVIEILAGNAAFSVCVRQLVEFSKCVCFSHSTCSFLFGSVYPLIQRLLHPEETHRRRRRLARSPLLLPLMEFHPFQEIAETNGFSASLLSRLQQLPLEEFEASFGFHQPVLSRDEFEEFRCFYPLVECRLRNVAIRLPHSTDDPRGLIIDVGDGVVFTEKLRIGSIPTGSLLHTGFFPSRLQKALCRGEQATHLWKSDLYRDMEEDDLEPFFPRFFADLWHCQVYSTYSEHPLANDIALSVRFRPSVELPTGYVPSSTDLLSETSLQRYDPFVARDAKTDCIPNPGLPMDVHVVADSFSLDLLPSLYSDFLLFFFLNLAEVPSVCGTILPRCRSCGWWHAPSLRCEDCWCVLSLCLNQCSFRLFTASEGTAIALGLLRCDSLQLRCYLHNTSTRLSLVIPSFLLADSVHLVFLPDAYVSPLVPFDSLIDPLEPSLVLTDFEGSERMLTLQLRWPLINLRPRFLLSLYHWGTEPLWATYDLPQAKDWPAKKGRYAIRVNGATLAVMRSTSIPEEDLTLEDGVHPAGSSLFRMRLNGNRLCFSLRCDCDAECVIDGPNNTMDCSTHVNISDLLVTRLLTVFSAPRPDSLLSLDAHYDSQPIDETVTAYASSIQLDVCKSSLAVRWEDVEEISGILMFQLSHTSSYLFSAVQEVAPREYYTETPQPLTIDRFSQFAEPVSPAEEASENEEYDGEVIPRDGSEDVGNDYMINDGNPTNNATNTTPQEQIPETDVEEFTDDDLADDSVKPLDAPDSGSEVALQEPASSNTPCSSTTFVLTIPDSLTLSLLTHNLPILSLSVSTLQTNSVFTGVCVNVGADSTRSSTVPYPSP